MRLSDFQGARPQYASKPDPNALHELDRITAISKALRTPLLEWQQYVARVASERDPNNPDEYKYKIVIVTVPRQSGKTTLMRCVLMDRALHRPRFVGRFTAQTGAKARERFTDLSKILDDDACILKPFARVKRGIGAESVEVEWNGRAEIRPFAPTSTAGHGDTPTCVFLDEAWAFDENLGTMLLGALIPSMQTIPDRQLWLISTAGDLNSTWFKSWVDRGRAAIGDPLSTTAYFEWSKPEHLDLSDPASWAQFHPAVGEHPHGIVTAETLTSDAALVPLVERERAYGNIWQTTSERTVIPLTDWDECVDDQLTPPADYSDVVIAYEVAQFSQCAAIVAGWKLPDGRIAVRTVLSDTGSQWVIPALEDIKTRLKPKAIMADDGGATREITDLLRLKGHEITTLRPREFMTATQAFIDAAKKGRIVHGGSPAMRECVQAAAIRPLGDAYVWSRRTSGGQIADLVAATVAYRGALLAPEPEARPRVVTV